MSWFTDEFSKTVFVTKYAGKYTDPITFFTELVEEIYDGDEETKKKIIKLMVDKKFSPGGRILAAFGSIERKTSLMNCTTHTVTGDSIEDISETAYTIMRASSRGQGIGIDLSKLRPKDAPVNNSAKTSTGSISFMELFDQAGKIIGQEGRRAALLFSLEISHPDIWRPGASDLVCSDCDGKGCQKCNNKGYFPYDFLHVKRIPGKVESANISVKITDDFMEAVDQDDMWELSYSGMSGGIPFNVNRSVRARDLFKALCASALRAAEPGVLFWGNMQTYSNSDLFDGFEITGVNACSETQLDQDGVCNLGSLNLSAFVDNPFTSNASFNVADFKDAVELAVRFLDSVITYELERKHYISEQQRKSLEGLRRIGLGVMGFADMLAMLGLPYDPKNSQTNGYVGAVFTIMRNTAYRTSVALAKEDGVAGVMRNKTKAFRKYMVEQKFYLTLPEDIRKEIIQFGIRNITLLSIAPTGSISNLFGVSSGIEPLFATEYTRRHRLYGADTFVNYVHPAVVQSRAAGLDDNDVWQTAYKVTPKQHLEMQAYIQWFIDLSISKTVNMPNSTTIEDIEKLYIDAFYLGIKGLAVYVDGSRTEQVLHEKDECPVCLENGNVVMDSGCKKCLTCGWSVCTI